MVLKRLTIAALVIAWRLQETIPIFDSAPAAPQENTPAAPHENAPAEVSDELPGCCH